MVLALAVVALAAAYRFRRWGRAAALVAVVLLLVVEAGNLANAHYQYFRTLGEAVGLPGPDEGTLAGAESDEGQIPLVGDVVPFTIPPTRSGFAARQAQAYLPPAWFAQPRPALPVILMLHGTPGGPTDWTEGGLAQATADAWAAGHGGVAPVLVMPDINGSLTGDTECVDSSLGAVETYLTVDVPAATQQELGTLGPGKAWVVAGLSEGGSCSIMLALRHPDLFTAFGDFGGLVGPRVGETNDDTADTVAQLFGGSAQAFAAHEPSTLLAANRYPQLGAWFEVGADDDQPYQAFQQLVPLSRAAGVTTCQVVVPGAGHTFAVWSAAFQASLPFFAERLGLVAPNTPLPAACGS